MAAAVLRTLVAIAVLACVQPLVAQGGNYMAGCTAINWLALQVSDPAFRDGVELARALTDHGVIVQCIAPSKMTGMFEEQVGAVLYRTNEGSFDALFLPKQRNFDGLLIRERRDGARYLYSVAGRPKPRSANLIDASSPVYFIKSLNRLVVADDRELVTHLGSILSGR